MTRHWTGCAYVARRIAALGALVVVSYRDDDPDDDVLRTVIGQMAAHDGARRLSLPPLSREAVGRLAVDRGVDADQLFRLTGGLPFSVREVLSTGPDEVPRTVADVVAARMARLSPRARQLASAAAVLARPADAGLLTAVAEVEAEALDECLASGTLVGGPLRYRFRHELTRMAVERAIPAHGRSRLHARRWRRCGRRRRTTTPGWPTTPRRRAARATPCTTRPTRPRPRLRCTPPGGRRPVPTCTALRARQHAGRACGPPRRAGGGAGVEWTASRSRRRSARRRWRCVATSATP
jgi:hypothetical protein